jgi:hypothetical protein
MKKQAKRQERLAVFKKKPMLTGAFILLVSEFNKDRPLPRQKFLGVGTTESFTKSTAFELRESILWA